MCLTARWTGSAANRYVRVTDISLGGCYVDTILEVSIGETIGLEILLDDDEWLHIEGVVAHHTLRLGFGLRFVNLTGQQRETLHTLLGIKPRIRLVS